MPAARPRTASDRAARDTPARCPENSGAPRPERDERTRPGPSRRPRDRRPAAPSARWAGPGPGSASCSRRACAPRPARPAMAVLRCALCRRTSFAGRRHLYSAGHRRRLQEALARLQEEVAAARAAAAAGAVRPLEPAED